MNKHFKCPYICYIIICILLIKWGKNIVVFWDCIYKCSFFFLLRLVFGHFWLYWTVKRKMGKQGEGGVWHATKVPDWNQTRDVLVTRHLLWPSGYMGLLHVFVRNVVVFYCVFFLLHVFVHSDTNKSVSSSNVWKISFIGISVLRQIQADCSAAV